MSTATDIPYLNLDDPEFRVNSPAVRAAADRHWYANTPWGPAVLRHDDLAELLPDRRLMQGTGEHLAAQGIVDGPVAEMWAQILLSLEGEDHARLRRLVSRAFTATSVQRLRARMRDRAIELVDSFAERGRCEFMTEFADHYPGRVIFDLLGFPDEDWETFEEAAHAFGELFGFSVAEHHDRIAAALDGLYAAIDRACEARRAQPREDLLTRLVQVRDGSDRLNDQELRSLVVILVIGGQDTMRGQLGYGIVTFAAHPEQWALLAARPELAERASAEVIRYHPAVPIIWRMAIDDFDYRDLHVPAGTRLWMMIHTAHREEAVYGPPAFDITVERPPVLMFGGGPHYCLGALLARAEMAEAFPVLAQRLPGLELDGEPTVRAELSGVMGTTHLPIRFGHADAAYADECRDAAGNTPSGLLTATAD